MRLSATALLLSLITVDGKRTFMRSAKNQLADKGINDGVAGVPLAFGPPMGSGPAAAARPTPRASVPDPDAMAFQLAAAAATPKPLAYGLAANAAGGPIAFGPASFAPTTPTIPTYGVCAARGGKPTWDAECQKACCVVCKKKGDWTPACDKAFAQAFGPLKFACLDGVWDAACQNKCHTRSWDAACNKASAADAKKRWDKMAAAPCWKTLAKCTEADLEAAANSVSIYLTFFF
jgi:hypothetical protein